MKAVLLTFLFLLSSTSLFAQQQSSEWERVYTFDDSIIEMNSAKVVIGGNIARVSFRWTFDQPEMSGQSQVKYKSRLEVIEFDCSDKRFRPYETTLFDLRGKAIQHENVNPSADWRSSSGVVMERLMISGCELMERRINPPVVSADKIELEKAAEYAFSFSKRLEQTRDIKPLIEKFFAKDYLDRYLGDPKSNWFWNLNPETAAQASRAELQRFYVALMNTGYLNCQYFTSQYAYAADGSIPEQKLIPADILELIDSHPYTAKYRGKQDSYDYLAENIDSLERLRSYTDLLERISGLMRMHVVTSDAEHSKDYQAMLESWGLYQPTARTCTTNCLGLPKGTRLFEVNVPVFRLQLAEIRGRLKVVSATDLFH